MFESSETLRSLILEFLGEKALMNVKEMQSGLSGLLNKTPTHQAIYKALHKLLKQGVLFQIKGLYGLSPEFIKKIQNFSFQISPEVRKQCNTYKLLSNLEQNNKISIHCLSQAEIRNNSLRLLLGVMEKHKENKDVYWHTRHTNTCYVGMIPDYRKMYDDGLHIHRIIHGGTPGDELGASFFRHNGENAKAIQTGWIEDFTEYGIYGDFIFSAKYDGQYCYHWDKLFDHGIEKLPEGTLESFINRGIPCTLTIEKNEVRARELKRVFT